MRPSPRVLLGLLMLLGLLVPQGEAAADPITPWPGERTAPGTLQLVPIVYVANAGKSFYPALYASTGIGEAWDVYVGVWGYSVAAELGTERGLDLIDIFPRYHIGEETALVLRLQLAPFNTLVTGAELHTNLTWERTSLMINTGVRPEFILGRGSLRAVTTFAMVAPEYHFTDQLSVYFEVNPALAYFTATGRQEAGLGAELALLPGLSFSLDPEEHHQFSVGAELALRRGETVSFADSVTFAAWYATSFDLGGRSGPAPQDSAPLASRRLGQPGARAGW